MATRRQARAWWTALLTGLLSSLVAVLAVATNLATNAVPAKIREWTDDPQFTWGTVGILGVAVVAVSVIVARMSGSAATQDRADVPKVEQRVNVMSGGLAVASNTGQVVSVENLNFVSVAREMSTPRELPPARQFVGRRNQLKDLVRLFCERSSPDAHAAMVALWGYPGVGKTGLALQLAYEIKDNYPDGQLYVDLQGYAEKDRLTAAQVLANWLVLRWGLARADLPRNEGALAAEFRSRLAGKRMLLVLDNAADEKTVRPLLPSTDSCDVIVTSRSMLAGLAMEGLRILKVDRLSPEDSIELLRSSIEPKARADGASLEKLAGHCGGLPLALKVVSGRIRTSPGSAARLASQLEDENKRFHLVSTFPNGDVDMSALFSWSYHALPLDAQRIFRLIGLHPAAGTTTDVYAMSVLADIGLDSAEELLNLLRSQSLLDGQADYRYDTHDLLRAYAKELIEQPDHAEERHAAITRLAFAYYGCANHAFDSLNRDNPMIDAEYLKEWREYDPAGVGVIDAVDNGHAWFALERSNVLSIVRTAAATKPAVPITARLACSLFYLLEVGGHLDEWAEIENIAEKAALGSGSRRDQAFTYRNRGRLAMVHILGDHQERLRPDDGERLDELEACRDAIALLKQAREIYREENANHGERWAWAGEATTVRELADAHRLEVAAAPSEGGAGRAIEVYLEAQRVYTNLDSANGLASLGQALGMTYVLDGQFDEGERCYRESLAYANKPNERGKPQHPRLKAFTLRRLGDLFRLQQRHEMAAYYYERCAIAFHDDIDDPVNRARALAMHGRSVAALGNTALASRSFDKARMLLIERRTLKGDDPEAQVVTTWLNALASDTATN